MPEPTPVSPYKSYKILSQRRFPSYGYIFRREFVDPEMPGCDSLEMRNCYSLDSGHWIGDPRFARQLCRKLGLRDIQKAKPTHCVASIGFHRTKKRWYGWSHRAFCSFGIGDRIFKERYGNDQTPFKKHGPKSIKTLADAKTAAKRFAAYVN